MVKKKPSTFLALISLLRPLNSLMIGLAVLVGIAVTTHSLLSVLSFRAALGFVTGFFISGFSMITNDIYDVQVDRINQPDRPIAKGIISVRAAGAFSLCLLSAGLFSAAFVSWRNLAIAVAFALVGWFYNYYGKKLGVLGNSMVALSVAIPYIFGAVSVGYLALNLAYLLALTSFLAGLGREVLKGTSDIVGDRIRNVKTIASTSGLGTVKKVTVGLFIAAVGSSLLPLALGLLGRGILLYSILILVPDAVFLILAIRVVNMTDGGEATRLKGYALIGMLSGLIAYFAAGLAY